jgi:hypothetical protein
VSIKVTASDLGSLPFTMRFSAIFGFSGTAKSFLRSAELAEQRQVDVRLLRVASISGSSHDT